MGLFESMLERHESERHVGILSRLAGLRSRPGTSDGVDGFLTVEKAAARMGVTEAELVAMVNCGQLEARELDGETLVRPAVVRVLAVREERAA
jgi:hypothetical protein